MHRQAIETDYLLGKLSDSESASLEERSFVDDKVFNEIEIAEDELIDAYVFGRLSAEDRERFENKLLKSERIAERVEFARLLSESRASQVMVRAPAKTSWWPGFFDFSFGPNPVLTSAAATTLFLIVLALPVFDWIRMRYEGRLNFERAAIEEQKKQLADQQAKMKELDAKLQNSKAEEARLQERLKTTEEQLAQTNRQPNVQPGFLASITLTPGSLRGPGQPEVLRVSPTTSTIQFKLVLDADDYDGYKVRIESSVNENVLESRVLKTTRSGRSRMIIYQFPAKRLPPGQYSVRVNGRTSSGTFEEAADYTVRVVEK